MLCAAIPNKKYIKNIEIFEWRGNFGIKKEPPLPEALFKDKLMRVL